VGSLRGGVSVGVSATGLGCLGGQGWAAQVENQVPSERWGRGKKAGDSTDVTQKQEPKREPGLLLMSEEGVVCEFSTACSLLMRMMPSL
jgi:hypothetical protein